jgi:phosphopantothenoylcysteine synthetase/decarboxylase
MNAPIVVLGVSGSIAAYKSADIASQLVKLGCDVRVVMTENATRFITPLTLHTLSRIALADSASLLLIAPASANVIAELANGLANHPLAEIALATRAPILIAPAMNGNMWEHPATKRNIESLKSFGSKMIGPSSGILACGYEGLGRLAETSEIIAAARDILRV